MLNILKSLSKYVLEHEQQEAESCAIPDESIADWIKQIDEELSFISQKPGKHINKIEQLKSIKNYLKEVRKIREQRCH